MLTEIPDIPFESPALEAIDFQSTKAFPDKITAIIQSIHDFTTAYNKDFNIDPKQGVKDHKEAKEKHAAIKKFIIGDAGPRFIKTVKKYTGIDIKAIVSDVPISNGNVGSIFCWLTKADEVTAQMILAAEGEDIPLDSDIASVKKHYKIAESLNRATGKILASVKNLEIYIGIPVSMFTYSDFLPSRMLKHQPTAEEMAAAMMHEVGHVFAFVEAFAKMSFSHRLGNNILSSVDTTVKETPKEALVLLRQLSRVEKKRAKGIKGGLTNLVEQLTKAEEAGYNDNFFFPLILKFLLNSLMTMSYLTYGISFVVMTDKVAYPAASFSNSKNSQSFSDRTKNTTQYERMADEYVSRYGYSRQLNSMLIKLHATFDFLTKAGFVPNQFNSFTRNCLTAQMTNQVINLPSYGLAKLVNIVFGNYSSYERDEIRLKRNIQNLRDGLSDSGVPPSMRGQVLKDITTMELQLKHYKRKPGYLIDKMASFMLMIVPKIISSGYRGVFTSGDVYRTYSNFLTQVDKLLSSKGHETAERIRALMRGEPQ